MRRFLVVGNQTLDSDELHAAIAERIAAGPCRFHLVVPATHPHDHFTWSEGEATALARARLDEALAWMHAEGAVTTGEVGDANPFLAVGDALQRERYDEIILSTFPPGLSRWIRQDLPHRVARFTSTPVQHVVASALKPEVTR